MVSGQTRLPFSKYSTYLPYPIKCGSLLLRNPLPSNESTRPWFMLHFTRDLCIIVSVWLSHLCDQCEWPGRLHFSFDFDPIQNTSPMTSPKQTSTEMQAGSVRQTAAAKWGKWAVDGFHFPKEIPWPKASYMEANMETSLEFAGQLISLNQWATDSKRNPDSNRIEEREGGKHLMLTSDLLMYVHTCIYEHIQMNTAHTIN